MKEGMSYTIHSTDDEHTKGKSYKVTRVFLDGGFRIETNSGHLSYSENIGCLFIPLHGYQTPLWKVLNGEDEV